MTSYRFVIYGPPRSKKNSPDVILLASKDGRGQSCPRCKAKLLTLVQPSPAWREWVKAATVETAGHRLVRAKVGGSTELVTYAVPRDGAPGVKLKPIEYPVNLEARIFRDADRGDYFGMLQGLGDFLEAWGIVADDKWIKSTDGSRLLIDRKRPRIDLLLTPIEPEPEQLAVGLPDEDDELVALPKAEESARA